MASNDQKRPEATHRQREALGVSQLPIGDDGRPMAIVQCGASSLVPTVQFGNVLISCVVTRAVPDDAVDDDALVVQARRVAKVAQTTAGAETRILQWAIDPSMKVTNPSGAPVQGVPSTSVPGVQEGDKITVETIVAPENQPSTPAPGADATGPAPDLPKPPSAE